MQKLRMKSLNKLRKKSLDNKELLQFNINNDNPILDMHEDINNDNNNIDNNKEEERLDTKIQNLKNKAKPLTKKNLNNIPKWVKTDKQN
jgi:acetyl-CoA carboxylase alpha subunit